MASRSARGDRKTGGKRAGKSSVGRRARSAAKPARSTPASGAKSRAAASERFVKDLLVRGEAAKPTRSGRLPLRATHVIVKQNADGTAEVRRVRYRTF